MVPWNVAILIPWGFNWDGHKNQNVCNWGIQNSAHMEWVDQKKDKWKILSHSLSLFNKNISLSMHLMFIILLHVLLHCFSKLVPRLSFSNLWPNHIKKNRRGLKSKRLCKRKCLTGRYLFRSCNGTSPSLHGSHICIFFISLSLNFEPQQYIFFFFFWAQRDEGAHPYTFSIFLSKEAFIW